MSNRKNTRLTPDEIQFIGREPNTSGQYRVTPEEMARIEVYRTTLTTGADSDTSTPQYQNDRLEAPKMSALDNQGFMMDIDQYCQAYGLPREDIRSYKLVSHTGIPYYNIAFHEKIEEKESEFLFDPELLADIVNKHIEPVNLPLIPSMEADTFDRLVFTDVHIGMNPNENGFSQYGGTWDQETIKERFEKMAMDTVANKQSDLLIVDDLGDYLDGWNNETTRKGHHLPQNMDNETQFDFGLEMKMLFTDLLAPYYKRIVFNTITNDNHAGSFGYVLNSAFKQIAEAKYSNIDVAVHRKFINHYIIGRHVFIITHGKDSKALKFGFNTKLDPKQAEKITGYIMESQIFTPDRFFSFSKGDTHLALFDTGGSDLFDYNNYPAFSPASEWIQTNFKRNESGFVLETIPYNTRDLSRKLIRF